MLVLGLPGNPASSMVSFELFVRPALRRLLGHPEGALQRPRAPVRLRGPLRVLGVWYAPTAVPRPERVVLEAIRRGFITARTCGVPWPLAPTWQLSAQAAEQIEKYLFQVARSTGTAFPFHDITRAMQRMHLQVSLDNPGQCDIVAGESPGRHPSSDEEMLAVWARELQRRVHSSELVLRGDERVLDVGCGPGRHAIELAGRGISVVGVDISSRFVEVASGEAERLGVDARFLRCDARALPFADGAACATLCPEHWCKAWRAGMACRTW